MPQPPHASQKVPTIVVRGGAPASREDTVVGEEPLQIRACGPGQAPEDVAITMRTPGHEEELAVGFLIAEGLLAAEDAAMAEFEFGDPAVYSQPHNAVLVRLPRPLDLDGVAERHFHATASCGICGRASVDELLARAPQLEPGPTVTRSVLAAMPPTMREAQVVFEATGGLHAAALFTSAGDLIEIREDIGRHNAVDKLVGARGMAGALPARAMALMVSGRVSFEIVQKAAAAGIPVLGAVSAPSDLAVSTAERVGMTLLGFVRDGGFNIYTGTERIALDA